MFIQENESGLQLIRNGKPFHMEGGAAHPGYLKELQEAGANTARIYDTINLTKTLDEAEELGLAVVVDIPMPKFSKDPEFYEDPEKFDRMKEKIERAIRKHKDHPALLYWNLGNELYYPYFYELTNFHSGFNEIIEMVHNIDPNHPVSTVTIGANKLRVLSIHRKSPDMEIISFNSFGTLSTFSGKLKPIAPIWSGPKVISEWGVNGPWEAQLTSWKAPLEETSTKKAEQIRSRYKDFIEPLKSENLIGTFIFYWGRKNEVTPTWYSLFGPDKKKTQAVFELEKIWKNHDSIYSGPELDYLFLNSKGANASILLSSNTQAEAEVILPSGKEDQVLNYKWEIRKESWDDFDKSEVVENVKMLQGERKTTITTPEEEGPYRLFVYLTDESEYIATANIPFYVLKKQDEN